MDDLLREFIVETGESLDSVGAQLVRFEQEPNNQDVLRALFRLVHTIKGTCGFLGLPRLEALSHAAESLMGCFRDGAPVTQEAVTLILATVDRLKTILATLEREAAEPDGSDGDLIARCETMARSLSGAAAEPAQDESQSAAEPALAAYEDSAASQSTLRVNVETLERLLTMVSELVLTRNQLLDVARQQSAHGFSAPLQRLSQVTTELQDCVMKTRMQPVGNAWRKLPRLVRDLGVELDKDIALELIGADTELDRQVLDLIKDPLTHLVRNAADHGLETRAERLAAGKPARGVITLSAVHVGGSIRIEVSDDGRGLDYARIRQKAAERGLIGDSERDRLADEQIGKFIFHPGFSTASKVTSISGRGVGLDVVHANVEKIGGSIEVQSQPGQGVTFSLSLPLTLAIVPALLVGAAGQQFAIPQSAVVELVHVDGESQARIGRLDGGRVLRARGEMLPLISLAETLGLAADGADGDAGFVAVLAVGAARFGLLVDQVFQTEEIVVKPLSVLLRHMQLYSGNTILGDGSVVLILDPSGLARAASLTGDGQKRARAFSEAGARRDVARADSTALLIFRSGGRRCAAPLSAIARLEEVQAKAVERAGGRPVTQYHGRLMPLFNAGALIDKGGAAKAPCLILSHGEKSVGYLVDAIIDVVEQPFTLDGGAGEGVLGAAILNGEAMDVIDALHFLRAAYPEIGAAAPRRPRRVLIVEESAFFRDMLAPVLRAAGHEVVGCASVDEAASLAPEPFDILIADPRFLAPDAEARARLRRLLAQDALAIAWCDDFDALRRAEWSGDGVVPVSKFDRERLLAALAGPAPEKEAA